jgi:hypothetical protein
VESPDSGVTAESLAILGPILFPCLDAAEARSLVEVGAFRGEFTRELLRWGRSSGASVTAIEPDPPPALLELRAAHPELELVEATSLDALGRVPLPDAMIIDGDHNYYTVSEELRLIEKRATQGLPLLLFHDVCWPHARRDTYYEPERIPAEHRQPLAHDARVAPGEPGLAPDGLDYRWVAEREGGPRNGVLTAIEDFVADRDGPRLAVVPAYFGLGVLWSKEAPWAGAVEEVVRPWDRDPLLERLEADRVAHVVRLKSQRDLLHALLHSRAFALAERLSGLRQGGAPVFSRGWVRRVLGE